MGTIEDAVEDKNSRKKFKKGKEKALVPEDGTAKKRMDRQMDGQAKGKNTEQDVEEQDVEENGSSPSTHSEKQKSVEEALKDHTDIELIQPEIKKIERDKKKRKRDAQEDMAAPNARTRIKKKARKEQGQQEARKSPDPVADNESSKKMKKQKRREKKKSSSESTTASEKQLEGTTKDKPGKRNKRKNETGFPDPEVVGEGELSDQAKKALAYAFTRFHEPGHWKFNKAKQNWLIRNVWSSKAIPEKYDGLVIRYLAAVQGNARENLIKTCQEVITSTQFSSDTGQDPQKSGASLGGSLIDSTSPTVPTEDAKRKAKAQALLQALMSKPDT